MSEQEVAILRQAYKNEQETGAFYKRAAAGVHNQAAKDMFSDLAKEEAVHQAVIRRQLEALTGGGNWQDINVEIKGQAAKTVPTARVVREIERELKPEDNDIDAVLYGIRLEMNSYSFYSDAAKQVSSSLGRSMYEKLAAMEARHYELLALLYESLGQTGSLID